MKIIATIAASIVLSSALVVSASAQQYPTHIWTPTDNTGQPGESTFIVPPGQLPTQVWTPRFHGQPGDTSVIIAPPVPPAPVYQPFRLDRPSGVLGR